LNEQEQKKQTRLKALSLGLVGVVFVAFSFYVIKDYLDTTKETSAYTISAHLPLDNVDPKEIWVDQIRTENEVVHGKVDYIQELLVNRLQEEAQKDQSAQKEITDLRSELDRLREEIKQNKSLDELRSELRSTTSSHHDPFLPLPPQETLMPLAMVTCPEPTNLHHVNRTIPTGTTVKAILMSSVDMPCGVQGSADPLPVKLRIIADGQLPHKVKALLKSGIVTASVYGDLSSERVYFRLEKLSQIRADGHYIETQVAGYVSGEDGKYGLRGVVVDKSAKLIENALLSGFLSGASSFFEAAAMARLSPYSCIVDGGSTPSWGQTAGQLAVAGGSEGVTNALDALTDYFIKRAEQLRPVIQITSGRIVDITFSDCADLGDLYTHERVRKSGKDS
jgi:conjugal transfer pilus assembly protein TraB